MSGQTQTPITQTGTETGEVTEVDVHDLPAREEALDEKGKLDLRRYLIKVQGGRQYLPVQARIIAFRHEFPDWSIETEELEVNWQEKRARFRCVVRDETGRARATGTKTEDVRGFGDFVEKAETGSVGRALSLLGLGTEYATDLNELQGNQGPRFADSPRQVAPSAAYSQPARYSDRNNTRSDSRAPVPADNRDDETIRACVDCDADINQAQVNYSIKMFGRPLCLAHQKQAREAQKAAGSQDAGQQPEGPRMAANGRDTARAVQAVQIKIREQRERIWGSTKSDNPVEDSETLYRDWLERQIGERSLKQQPVTVAQKMLERLEGLQEHDWFDDRPTELQTDAPYTPERAMAA